MQLDTAAVTSLSVQNVALCPFLNVLTFSVMAAFPSWIYYTYTDLAPFLYYTVPKSYSPFKDQCETHVPPALAITKLCILYLCVSYDS
jgi:hypothetical protein